MTRIQFGHGGHKLEGWLNLEQHEADITKPLAFKNDSVDFIFIEHVLEHVTPQQGYSFLLESYRILKPSGVVRIVVPDIEKVSRLAGSSEPYIALLKEGFKTWYPAIGKSVPEYPTTVDAIESLIFCHGHQAIYTEQILKILMATAGFYATPCEYGKSRHHELNGVDSHWKWMTWETCVLESTVVEAQKPPETK